MTSEENFGQLKLKFIDPIQHDYEAIRPIVLYAQTVSDRSQEIGLERRRVGEKAQQFILAGMLGLGDERAGKAGRKAHEYPEPVATHILYLLGMTYLSSISFEGAVTTKSSAYLIRLIPLFKPLLLPGLTGFPSLVSPPKSLSIPSSAMLANKGLMTPPLRCSAFSGGIGSYFNHPCFEPASAGGRKYGYFG